MTAAVRHFPVWPRRLWLLREDRPGEWQGLRLFGDDLLDQTPVGPEWLVEAVVKDHRRGLPIVREPNSWHDDSGHAA